MKRVSQMVGLWTLRVATAMLALAILFIVVTPQGRTGLNTLLFVLQALELPVRPQSWFTDEPLRDRMQFGSDHAVHMAEVYRLSGDSRKAAVVLSVGATPHGLNDPPAVMLGDALARAGYVTMLHWSPRIGIQSNIDPSHPNQMVQAFMHLETLDYVDPDRIGIGGFCVGASLALVAAADPAISDRVGFVNAFGPFYDAEALLIQAVSGTVEYDGQNAPWKPDPHTLRVLAAELIEHLDDPSDVRVLTNHYLDGETPTRVDHDALSEQGRIAARLLEGVRQDEARTLYEMLPASFHEDLAAISPSTYVHNLRARLLIMHDRHDEYVPAAESRRLLSATRDRLNVRYTEFIGFDHLLPDEDGALTRLGQALSLYRHMYSILRIAS